MMCFKRLLFVLQIFAAYAHSMHAEKRFFSEMITTIASYFLSDIRQEYADHPYYQTQATIREGYDICDQEKAYCAQRLPAVQQAMESFLDQQVTGTAFPTIAFCCSGGGYRAMLSTLGALQGAQEIGLYGSALYSAGVSGGAWALAALAQSGDAPAACLERIATAIDASLLDDFNHAQVEQALLKQVAFTKRCSLVDLYGALLAQKLLASATQVNPSLISADQQAYILTATQQPFPIYSSALDAGNNHYEWVEFNPYEVSCVALGSAIPLWAFGRTFDGGASTNDNPAQTAGYCMGIWGSSFVADIKDIANDYLPELSSRWLAYILGKIVNDLPNVLSDGRVISPEQVANWNYGTQLPGGQARELPLMDAGFMCNLPVLPLLRKARSINILVIFDASESGDAYELRWAQEYAREHALLFPPIDYTQTTLPCSVHADWSNPQVPVIIYFPLVAQAGYCNGWDPDAADFTSTFNFSYTYAQAMLLAGLMEYSVVQNQQLVQATVSRVLAGMA